jgi:hypothetical protein
MTILSGDIIQIREENFSADGVVVDIVVADNWAGVPTMFVLTDFGGPQPGRIPLDADGNLPRHHHLVSAG